ncbi:MAG: hypothetical protein HY973_00725 [Candidatus Kerfeldbacteria bacterium]|nr:hypothetical protein [Candidatus Kerfeldbacteria bacterium]
MPQQSKALVLTILLSIGLAIAAAVFFQPTTTNAFDIKLGIVGNLGSAQCQATGDCTLCDFVDLFTVLQKVILSIFAGLALIMLIWGGQTMIMAAGNQEKFTAGRKLITSTLFSVLIILAAYFLTNILYSILASPSKANAPTCTAQKGTILSSPDPVNNVEASCGAGLSQVNASDVTKPNVCCKAAVLSQDWWKERFSCPASPSDANYCKDKKDEDNVACSSVVNGICRNKKCVTNTNITPNANDKCANSNGVCVSEASCTNNGNLGKKDCSKTNETCCKPENAGTCSSPAQCTQSTDCVAPYKESDWGIKNCSAGQTCCKFKPVYTPGTCSSPAQCVNRGGCSTNDEDWGPKNCSTGQTCCVLLCPPQKSCRKESSCISLGAQTLPQYTCKKCNSDQGCGGNGPTVCCDNP